jgi:hypothetical protein
MLNRVDHHTDLIGKIAKLTDFGVEIEKQYQETFKIGNYSKAQRINHYCYLGNKYEMSLIFINEKPIKRNGVIWFCLKEIGFGVSGDLHWFTLNQLMISE